MASQANLNKHSPSVILGTSRGVEPPTTIDADTHSDPYHQIDGQRDTRVRRAVLRMVMSMVI